MIKWKRPNDGFCYSRDGEWRIVPLFCGCVKPQFFDLYYKNEKICSMLFTQREAKERAEEVLTLKMLGSRKT